MCNFIIYLMIIFVLSDEIETSLSSGDDESMITLYTNLTNISCQLQTSMCRHLVNYVHETLHFWHNLIKEKLTKYVFFLAYIINIP